MKKMLMFGLLLMVAALFSETVVLTEYANLRLTPTTKEVNKIGVVKPGTYEVLATKTVTLVKAGEITGWMASYLLDGNVVKGLGAKLHATSDLESPEVGRVNGGVTVQILKSPSIWFQINYKEKIGWVYKSTE